MIRTVDLVLCGDGEELFATSLEAVRAGRRVLVVIRSRDARFARELRRALAGASPATGCRFSILTAAEVVCVDGVGRVEAVLVRYLRTGRLRAVNASGMRSCDGASGPRGYRL